MAVRHHAFGSYESFSSLHRARCWPETVPNLQEHPALESEVDEGKTTGIRPGSISFEVVEDLRGFQRTW